MYIKSTSPLFYYVSRGDKLVGMLLHRTMNELEEKRKKNLVKEELVKEELIKEPVEEVVKPTSKKKK